MTRLYSCASGHQWLATPSEVVLCPQCGSPALGLDGPRAAETPQAPTVPAQPSTLPHGQSSPRPFGAPFIPGYEILEEIGKGGMGIVYRARQLSLNRRVALKVLRRWDTAGFDELQRFQIEAQAVARLTHPHIVPIYDHGSPNGVPYFSMELLEGGTLADRIAHETIPPRETAALVEQLARAMAYAHQEQIVHRDLKPTNVLLHRDGTPKIADFSLAKLLDGDRQLTRTYAVMGTASYMAPEQARGQTVAVGPAADTWALGAILYEMLCGRPPFLEATFELTRLQVLNAEPLRPSSHRAGVPTDLEEIALRCLEKEPGDRYRSALELAEDLRRFLAGEPLSITPLSEWDRQVRWGRGAGYELLELTGCTTVGLVFTARRLSLNRPVTLQTVASEAKEDADHMARFRRAAEAAAELHHPNILQIYDLGEHQGQPYVSVEFVEGGSLAERCTGEPCDPRHSAQLIETLARAIHVAHQHGIVHADLRPYNVRLTGDGVPRITGFGFAILGEKGDEKETGRRRPQRFFSGYLAPEQVATGGPVGPAVDVHALGAMLYEMLTGQPPFAANTVEHTRQLILHLDPAAPSQLLPSVPRRLEAICLKCLRKDPTERHSSALALANELHHYLDGEDTKTDEFELVPGYELLDELGRGGTGVVYRARQISLDRLVALKLFRDDVQRVLAANRAVARLSHPNLVTVFDCGESDGVLYVAEELVSGQSLDELIATRRPSPDRAAALVEELARAMHHAHQHGIIHRNLKPSVVLLTEEGVPRISSFDLASLASRPPEGELEGQLVGTPAYMAPEQVDPTLGPIGPATDVHGLGLILYELLTGQPAYRDSNPMLLFMQVRQRPPRPLRALAPHVPAGLEAVCLRCLEKAPGGRFGSAKELADALETLTSGRGIFSHF
jgi:serine/threonine protein kinase